MVHCHNNNSSKYNVNVNATNTHHHSMMICRTQLDRLRLCLRIPSDIPAVLHGPLHGFSDGTKIRRARWRRMTGVDLNRFCHLFIAEPHTKSSVVLQRVLFAEYMNRRDRHTFPKEQWVEDARELIKFLFTPLIVVFIRCGTLRC